MVKKALWLLSVLLFLSSCNPSDEEPTPIPDKDSVTVLSYLIANNDLDDELLFNIEIMYDGLKSMDKPATLLVYWDGKKEFYTANDIDREMHFIAYLVNGLNQIVKITNPTVCNFDLDSLEELYKRME